MLLKIIHEHEENRLLLLLSFMRHINGPKQTYFIYVVAKVRDELNVEIPVANLNITVFAFKILSLKYLSFNFLLAKRQ